MSRTRWVRRLVWAGAATSGLVLATASPGQAGPVSGLYNTGVSDTLGLDAFGTGDSHYRLVTSPDSSAPQPVFAGPTASKVPVQWLAPSRFSTWIGANSSTTFDDVPGTYDYQTTFSIADGTDLSGLSISGHWAADNAGTEILVNGVLNRQTVAWFYSWSSFLLSSGFVDGANTLDFIVSNTGSGVSPTGLRVEFADEAVASPTTPNTDVPEPASVGTLGVGLLALSGLVARTRRSSAAL